MRSASVSQLKARLSEFLGAVKKGHDVLITDRGRPVGRIVPFSSRRKGVPNHLADLERAGLARIGSGRLPVGFWDRPRPRDDDGAVLRALIDEREERS